MAVALSACRGASIMVSRCKRHCHVGKWWLCKEAGLWARTVCQQFPEFFCGVGLWKWIPATPSCFYSIKGAHVSLNCSNAWLLNYAPTCLKREATPSVGGDSSRRLQVDVIHVVQSVTQPCLPAWWRLFMPNVAVTVGNLSIAFVFMCVIQSPTLFMLHLKWEPSLAK